MSFRNGAVLALFSVFFLSLAGTPVRAEDPVRIHMVWSAVPGQMAPILYQKTEILKHYGKSYIVEPVYYKGSGPQITALASGELEIATYAPAAFALSIQNAHMDDIRIIGDSTRDGFGDYFSRQYNVVADSPIKSIQDLKGKIIGDNSIGGAMDMAFRYFMRKNGLEDKRDYQIVEVDLPNQFAFLTEKKIDLAFMTTPFSVAAQKSGKIRTLFTMKDAIGESEVSIMTARTAFIAAHRAALVDFFEDTQNALRWFADPANRTEALGILSRFAKKPASEYEDWAFNKGDDYRDLDARPNLDAIQRGIDQQRELGLLKLPIDVKKYADLSLVDEAAKRPR